MRVVFCWAGIQGYSAACFRRFRSIDGVDLHVVHLNFQDVPLNEDLLSGVSNTELMASEPNLQLTADVEAYRPDVIFVCGWFYAPYRRLLRSARLRSSAIVLGMDTPWTGSLRQHCNRVRLSALVRRLDRVVVAGARSWALAMKLGVPSERIRTGLYGFDFESFAAHGGQTKAAGHDWPRSFLFAGRYAPVKGLGVLVEAYRAYRLAVENPWSLYACGVGTEAWRFHGEGIVDLGYVQPSGLPAVFANHGVFVLPSLQEPWGVALAEAAASGSALICTDACGAAEQLLEPGGNGIVVPAGDVGAMADAMVWMHQHAERLRAMGARSVELARQHSAAAWAERTHEVFREVLLERSTHPARSAS